jgi:hypothetical protein
MRIFATPKARSRAGRDGIRKWLPVQWEKADHGKFRAYHHATGCRRYRRQRGQRRFEALTGYIAQGLSSLVAGGILSAIVGAVLGRK